MNVDKDAAISQKRSTSPVLSSCVEFVSSLEQRTETAWALFTPICARTVRELAPSEQPSPLGANAERLSAGPLAFCTREIKGER
eukprot:9094587-Pyramimonas_sp.AAC.2